MTLKKRLQLATAAVALAAGVAASASSALAASPAAPAPLSHDDAQHYTAALDASARGDFIGAEIQSSAIHDKSLLGYISFSQLMRPATHTASFEELAAWLGKFRDLPLANRVFNLAAQRKPSDSLVLPTPVVASLDTDSPAGVAHASTSSERTRRAREAFYSGDVRRALALAPQGGDRWIAGLAAYRLKSYEQAHGWFNQLARDSGADPWVRSAAAFWAARAASALGDTADANAELRLAARNPGTFYGMIAARQLRQSQEGVADDPIGAQLIQASYAPDVAALSDFVRGDPRAHRAAALAQIGRLEEAGEEVRAGLALAATPDDKARWTRLADSLGASTLVDAGGGQADYPAPLLAPKDGFTVDKALVYAIVRQESRFNPLAVSPVGAVGLMQLMPEAAARAAGDDKLRADTRPLFDPALNLRVGQDYLTWLMQNGAGYDLLRVVAAYNGGPTTLQRTVAMLGGDPDPLMLIECLPALETRNYVERVMAGYWTYKKMFGEEVHTLDAIAAGARIIDARLDLTQPLGAPTELSGQPLQTALR